MTYCTDLDAITSHLREALSGTTCQVIGSEGVSIQASARTAHVGVRLSADGFREGEVVHVIYQAHGRFCSFFATVLHAGGGRTLIQDPEQILLRAA